MSRNNKLFTSPVKIMGILNTTPDSFSDGGLYNETLTAVQHAHQLINDGAEIIDIGGESSRPGSQPVSLPEELRRVIPVIKALRKESSVTISIDTTKAEVARQALLAGGNIINDISGLSYDPKMIEVLQNSNAEIVLMHMQGTPAYMQKSPCYLDVIEEVYSFLSEKIAYLTAHNISEDRIIVDPGIGFGKTLEHNINLLKNLRTFSKLGVRVLLGHSRKRFLGEITSQDDTAHRDLATAVTTALCASRAVDIVRVHNVAATSDALLIAEALRTN